ncbi:MAG: PAS domain S-box protein [Gemmatimonadaceae bacterium]|nr:PAS domain S-box protein [Gemmatimonadaceae bacterium]
MPLAPNRSATIAVRIALALLLVSAVVTGAAMWRGAVWRRAELGVVVVLLVLTAAILVYALARAHAVEERVRALQEVDARLRASEAKFAGILDIAADAIITVDERHHIMHYNQGAEQIFGYSAAEMLGQPLDRLLPNRFRSAHRHHMQAFAAGPDTARRMGERREIYGVRKSGEEFPAEASISKLDTPNGPLFTVVLRDITARKRTEWEQRFLAMLGERLASSIDYETTVHAAVNAAVPDLADGCMLDLMEDGRFVSRVVSDGGPAALHALAAAGPLNWDSPARVVDVLRTGRAELVPEVTPDWIEAHTDDRPAAAEAWRALSIRSLIIVPLVARGSVLGALTLISTSPTRRYGEDDLALAGKLAFRLTLAIENARLYRAARTATRARDEILGIVSHDLRNPLSAIAMCAHGLSEAPADAAHDREELVGAILESAEWMQRLIRDLLDVSAIEAGHLSVERRPEDVGAMVHAAMGMLAGAAAQRGVIMRAELPEGLPRADADAERIVQVLTNLISNAIKFTEPGGCITVRAEANAGGLQLDVEDTGVGIAADDQPHVFERYWQARHARRRGSGLGLAIVKGIVEAHGGRIWLRSTPGKGSTFSFTLPRAADAA